LGVPPKIRKKLAGFDQVCNAHLSMDLTKELLVIERAWDLQLSAAVLAVPA
jgi:hypothetical protein